MKWFSITNRAADSAEISIHGAIGEGGITAAEFARELTKIEAGRITLRINSPGGSVFGGIAIRTALLQHKAVKSCHIEGLCASAATLPALACDNVRIAEDAFVMIHDPTMISWGDAEDMSKSAALLEKIAQRMANIYAERMRITVADARQLMRDETWWDSQEAVDAKFCDGLLPPLRVAAAWRHPILARAPKAVAKRFAAPQMGLAEFERLSPSEKCGYFADGNRIADGGTLTATAWRQDRHLLTMQLGDFQALTISEQNDFIRRGGRITD